MDGEAPGVSPEELLTHAAWLRRLARALAGEGPGAEDAVQDTYLAALTTPPARDRPLRPWLATVVRNFLRRQHRTQSRRERRERASAPSWTSLSARPSSSATARG
jgi:DNA-directed RNA polymerase specialized sigma24 family protein